MTINQLSLFLENKPGHLRQAVRTLADAGVNILTLNLADTQQFGILRLIVRDWQKAKDALEKAGFVVNLTPVVAAEVADHPGGLADMLDVVAHAGANIEYMYAFTLRKGDKAVMVIRFDNPEAAVEALRAHGQNIVSSVELYERS
jgi:hypothetical protein